MENEIKNNTCDYATAVVPEAMFNGRMPTESEKSAMELRLLMAGKEGEEKCTLCRAAQCLEKCANQHANNWLDGLWMFLMIWAASDFGKDAGFTEAFCRNYLESVEKRKKEEGEKHE